MKKSVFAAAAAVALTATLAFAAPQSGQGQKGERQGKGHYGQKGMHGKAGMGHMAAKLNLTEAQQEQMRSIRTAWQEQNKGFLDQFKATKQQYREARKSGDTARAEALRPTLDAQKAQMTTLRQDLHQRILPILTPEQRQQMEAMKAQHGERKGHRRNMSR